jgi:aspartokinase/homoserine dehydrogenase 1
VCFAVPEKEVGAVAEALNKRFKEALEAGRLSRVCLIPKADGNKWKL